jgi:predicted nucleic acid-binding protein
MMLLDSNIIIYAALPEHAELRRFIAACAPAVSAISTGEVLGFHRLTEADRRNFEEFFAASTVLPLDPNVLAQAIALRQKKKMTSLMPIPPAPFLAGQLPIVYT